MNCSTNVKSWVIMVDVNRSVSTCAKDIVANVKKDTFLELTKSRVLVRYIIVFIMVFMKMEEAGNFSFHCFIFSSLLSYDITY